MTANQIAYLNYLENARKNRAAEMETHRTNVANEIIRADTNKINKAKYDAEIAETVRSNLENAAIKWHQADTQRLVQQTNHEANAIKWHEADTKRQSLYEQQKLNDRNYQIALGNLAVSQRMADINQRMADSSSRQASAALTNAAANLTSAQTRQKEVEYNYDIDQQYVDLKDREMAVKEKELEHSIIVDAKKATVDEVNATTNAANADTNKYRAYLEAVKIATQGALGLIRMGTP